MLFGLMVLFRSVGNSANAVYILDDKHFTVSSSFDEIVYVSFYNVANGVLMNLWMTFWCFSIL